MARVGVLILLGAMAGGSAHGASQTLDSVVASLGNVAITASDVQNEYQFESFLQAKWPPPPPDAEALHAARRRLAYQMLLIQEENPGPSEKSAAENAAAELVTELREGFANPAVFRRALDELGMTEAELRSRLAQQELVLRLIDQRLRPAASPSDDDVAAYYRSTFVPDYQKRNGGAAAPPLAAVEGQIREVLVQKRINELLDEWIEELKPTANLRFHSF